jgi:hypothetical protein
MHIFKSAKRYEHWLRRQLDDDIVEKDIVTKHEKMAESAFQFLRATYWRWAETIYDIYPEAKGAPHVLAVGDIHVENFGTWRDAEGRLTWGVNDFDEAAGMPYVLDLMRLAASAVLAKVPGPSPKTICKSIAEGYAAGLRMPRPFVLDRDHGWLREAVGISVKERKKFWKKFDPERIEEEKPEKIDPVGPGELRGRYRKALEQARPDRSIAFQYFARQAGTGSLGRRRVFGVGPWQGDLIVREAKAMLRSAWALEHGGAHRLRCTEIAAGPYRSPDPTYHLRGHVLVRRLSPNDFKIEADTRKKGEEEKVNAVTSRTLISSKMLHAMGHELASIHGGTLEKDEIEADLAQREDDWLHTATRTVCAAITAEWREWRDHPDQWPGAGRAG